MVLPTSSTTKTPNERNSVTDSAIEFMKKQSSDQKPFYVQVSYYAQHLSVVTTDEMLAKYESKGTPDRRYTQAWAAMMEELDHGIGRLIDTIDQLKLDENTYIFLTADNGGRGSVPAGGAERDPTNIPLTGAKHSLYEGGIRVPFVATGPGITHGSVCRTPVVGYDFLPTFFDLAGGEESQLTDEVDGVSFAGLLSDPVTHGSLDRSTGSIIFHRPEKLFSAIRERDHKLMLFWKRNGEVDRHELFDVNANPTEEGNDLSVEKPDKAESMKPKLTELLRFRRCGQAKSETKEETLVLRLYLIGGLNSWSTNRSAGQEIGLAERSNDHRPKRHLGETRATRLVSWVKHPCLAEQSSSP